MNRETPSRRQRRSDREAVVIDTISEAMRRLGWMVPRTEAEVLEAEAQLPEAPVGLPDALRDPEAAWTAGDAAARIIRLETDPDIEATLARAAREGRTIGPEIERTMRADRLAAEREQDDGTGAPTDTP